MGLHRTGPSRPGRRRSCRLESFQQLEETGVSAQRSQVLVGAHVGLSDKVAIHARAAQVVAQRHLADFQHSRVACQPFEGCVTGPQFDGMRVVAADGGQSPDRVNRPAQRLDANLARELPLEALVLETDAPDIATAAHRGERNSPEYLPEVLAALAEVRDQPPAEIAAATTATARALLGLPAEGAPAG